MPYTFDPACLGLSGSPAIIADRGGYSFYLAATSEPGAYEAAAVNPDGGHVQVLYQVDADQGAEWLRDVFGLGDMPAEMLGQLKAAAVQAWEQLTPDRLDFAAQF